MRFVKFSTALSAVFAAVAPSALAHGVHLQQVQGHSHAVEIVGFVAAALITSLIIKKFARL